MTANTFTSLKPNVKETYPDPMPKKKRKFKVLEIPPLMIKPFKTKL